MSYINYKNNKLDGPRYEIKQSDDAYPNAFRVLENPPASLYIIGQPTALKEGLAIVGARKATPYGISCAKHFAGRAAERGITIISGGARGCDAVAHDAALSAHGKTVAFLGGGLNELYPAENIGLFQRIIDQGGAIVSENEWNLKPLPYTFRMRNRLIAGLSRATLIVEAGLPSGTFSTADAALAANHEVLVVPGSITSKYSHGANLLIYQGAVPIIDDDTFDDQLLSIFGCLKIEQLGSTPKSSVINAQSMSNQLRKATNVFDDDAQEIFEALCAQPQSIETLRNMAVSHVHNKDPLTALMIWLAEVQRCGLVSQYPDGRYGACVSAKIV